MSRSTTAVQKSGYRGNSLAIIEESGAKAGSRVKVQTHDGFETEGLLVPRYEHADSEHVVIKLKSGYNIGISASSIKTLRLLDQTEKMFGDSSSSSGKNGRQDSSSTGKNLLLLSTGGTIASRVDYRTGAVHPALSAEDLYETIPELGSIASVTPDVLFSTYSENLTPADWQKLSEGIISRYDQALKKGSKIDGIVVMLGTDTLAYVSAALSFSLIGLPLPVVCVGAQRSSDRPSSDAALNLKAACTFAVRSGLPGVYVSMHNSENDDLIAVHRGSRVRKNHTSRRDAFESIDSNPVAQVAGDELILDQSARSKVSSKNEFRLETAFSSSVALVKFHPGFDSSILDYYGGERKVRGVIIEGTGLGHVSSSSVSKISRIVESGVFVGMSSQCIWGHVDLNVYETGRDLIAAGVVPLGNMLAETAFAKLSWCLGNFESRTRDIMVENLVGEMTERIELE